MDDESTPILVTGERVSSPSEASIPQYHFSFYLSKELAEKLNSRSNDFDRNPEKTIEALLGSIHEDVWHGYRNEYEANIEKGT